MTRTRQACIVVAIAAVAVAVAFSFDPVRTGMFPKCVFYQLTGWYCPGCGAARAFHHLLHGRLHEALCLNPLAALLVPGVLAAVLWEKISPVLGRRWSMSQIPPVVVWTLAGVIFVFGIVRNVPAVRFSPLAP
ncbi:MAG: DUF2752 domain-containing protein [Verrucomicrobiae bacterium]|nr:DUF2752 domain-containing protein [Verrucomicrobiae bacterium]